VADHVVLRGSKLRLTVPQLSPDCPLKKRGHQLVAAPPSAGSVYLVSFRSSKSSIRERADPKGEGGGGGRRMDHLEPHAGPHVALREPYADPRADLEAAAQTCTQTQMRLRRLRRATCAGETFPHPGCGS
jgi:hypothetical protein